MFLGIMSAPIKKKQDDDLILFSALDLTGIHNVKHKSIFFLLLEVILHMYIIEHSVDSRHISISTTSLG